MSDEELLQELYEKRDQSAAMVDEETAQLLSERLLEAPKRYQETSDDQQLTLRHSSDFIVFTDSMISGAKSEDNKDQDKDPTQYELLDDGKEIRMWGNNWKAIDLPTTIADNTWIEFEFKSVSTQAEKNGFGFSNGVAADYGKSFEIDGSQGEGGG